MFESVLVANRGEIARRVLVTARRLGMRTIAVHSEVDSHLPFVVEADEAWLIPGVPSAMAYRSANQLIDIARKACASCIHPGYGFLSENADFAEQVINSGIGWIGPSPGSIRVMADKIASRNLVAALGVPVLSGTSTPIDDVELAVSEVDAIGYPVMLKAALGGGGMGMTLASDEGQFRSLFKATRDRAQRLFGSPDVLLEVYVERARHVEIQILGYGDGVSVAMGERECSVQRRNQKVIEESPSCIVDPALRAAMSRAAEAIGNAVSYSGVGTVECLVDAASRKFYFLEMNTRLQVEHPVTELVTGQDLVELQFLVAAGERPELTLSGFPGGHAIEMRVYAEDPVRFLPSPGVITAWKEPTGEGIRLDTGYGLGNEVTPFYDPLLAKLCVWAPDRAAAIKRAEQALSEFDIGGLRHNLPFLTEVLSNDEFRIGDYDTGLVTRMQNSG